MHGHSHIYDITVAKTNKQTNKYAGMRAIRRVSCFAAFQRSVIDDGFIQSHGRRGKRRGMNYLHAAQSLPAQMKWNGADT